MPYLFLCKGKLIYWVTHVTEIKPLTVLILTSSVKNENRKIMNTIIIVLFTHRWHFLFFKVNFQITDLSKDGLPRVKVFIPDSMPQATVQYDEAAMVIHVKDPSLGWVARIDYIIQVKNNRQTRLGRTELESYQSIWNTNVWCEMWRHIWLFTPSVVTNRMTDKIGP